jgi:hypothetical protein
MIVHAAGSDHELLPSQRNDVLGVIERTGFDPREFAWAKMKDDWTGADDPYVPAIVHQPTRFFCAISNRPFYSGPRMGMQGNFQVQVSPGFHRLTEEVTGIPSFAGVLIQVHEWLARVRREQVPDRWTELEASRALAGVIEHEPDNTSFTTDERARIGAALEELRAVAVRLELPAAQLHNVNITINYLQPAAGRLGRTDWFAVALQLFTWAVPFSVFSAAVFRALAWVVHLPMPPMLPPIGP